MTYWITLSRLRYSPYLHMPGGHIASSIVGTCSLWGNRQKLFLTQDFRRGRHFVSTIQHDAYSLFRSNPGAQGDISCSHVLRACLAYIRVNSFFRHPNPPRVRRQLGGQRNCGATTDDNYLRRRNRLRTYLPSPYRLSWQLQGSCPGDQHRPIPSASMTTISYVHKSV